MGLCEWHWAYCIRLVSTILVQVFSNRPPRVTHRRVAFPPTTIQERGTLQETNSRQHCLKREQRIPKTDDWSLTFIGFVGSWFFSFNCTELPCCCCCCCVSLTSRTAWRESNIWQKWLFLQALHVFMNAGRHFICALKVNSSFSNNAFWGFESYVLDRKATILLPTSR